MADPWFDAGEIFEYGEAFLDESVSLVGKDPIVNVEALRAAVEGALGAYERELAAVGVLRSDLRGSRTTVADAAPQAREVIERTHHWLLAKDPAEETFEIDAFFPGGLLGPLSTFKPADLTRELERLLRAFDLDKHAELDGRERRRAAVAAAHEGLGGAVAGRSGATGVSIRGTDALTTAREAFLHVYTDVAKNVVRGLLARLGRSSELRLFFLDLQVDEGAPALPPEPIPVAP